MRQFEILLFI